MIKPLVLKTKENNSLQSNKNQLLTVNDLISRFSIKSPTSQICLTDRSSTSTRSISSSKNKQFFKRKSFKTIQLNEKQQFNGFRKTKLLTTTNANNKQFLLFQKINFKTDQKKDKSTKSEKKLQLNLQFLKNKQNKSQVSQIVRQIKIMKQKKQNNVDLGQKVTKITKMKLQRPLTDRSQQKFNKYPQTISYSNIRPEIVQINNNQACKSYERESNVCDFDIKTSNCSTLSLKSKHTLSLHNFEEYQELFTKQECKNQNQIQKCSQIIYPTLNQLQKVKEKIYTQIYSLDKKLLPQDMLKKTKKSITISLRRKQKYVEQKQDCDHFFEVK